MARLMSEELFDWNVEFEPLARILNSVSEFGSHYASGSFVVPVPRIEVKGAGLIPFPVPVQTCRQLVETASQAPYGKGEQTLIDTSVRNSWQIEPGDVSIGGSTWSGTLARILGHVTEELGFPAGGLSAEFYKLLVYERGGFFAPHRDTEKARAMVATLVIALPVAGEGGELAIRHGNMENVIDMRSDEPSELHYAAFFADCVHEIRPVKDGHRIALVFNLIAKTASGKTAASLDHVSEIQEATVWLGELKDAASAAPSSAPRRSTANHLPYADEPEEAERPRKIVWPLQHNYSEAGLSFANLKGVDRMHARILAEAADLAGYSLNAAILHVHASGSAEGYEYFGYRDHDEEDERVEGVEIAELIEVTYTLDNWAAPDGSLPALGKIPVETDDFVPSDVLEDIKPDEEWIHEATGNAGATAEHAYRIAVLVLWPSSSVAEVLADAGIDRLINYIAGQRTRPGADRSEVLRLGWELIELWPLPPSYGRKAWTESCANGLEQIVALGDRRMIAQFLADAVMANYTGCENATVIAGARALGHHEIWRRMPEFVGANILRHFNEVTELTGGLHRTLGKAAEPSEPDLFPDVARRIAAELPVALRENRGQALSLEAMSGAFTLLWNTGLRNEAEVLAGELAGLPEAADPFRKLPQTLDWLATAAGDAVRASAGYGILWQSAAKHLHGRSGIPPVLPADWRIPLVLEEEKPAEQPRHRFRYSKQFQDEGKELNFLRDQLVLFCNDPQVTTYKFAARESLRASLKSLISRLNLDLDCYTETKGRPYKLVCKKNRKSFKRRLKQYRGDIAAMQLLISISPSGTGEELRQELQRSVERASEAPTAVRS